MSREDYQAVPLAQVTFREAIQGGKNAKYFTFVSLDPRIMDKRGLPKSITYRPDVLAVVIEWNDGVVDMVPFTNCKSMRPAVTLSALEAATGLLGEEVAELPEEEQTPPPSQEEVEVDEENNPVPPVDSITVSTEGTATIDPTGAAVTMPSGEAAPRPLPPVRRRGRPKRAKKVSKK